MDMSRPTGEPHNFTLCGRQFASKVGRGSLKHYSFLDAPNIYTSLRISFEPIF